MTALPSKLDAARAKVQIKLTAKGVQYPTILYRTKAVTGTNPQRGVKGTTTNTDTTLTGAFYEPTGLAEQYRSGGLLQEGSIRLDKVSLTVTESQIQAAKDPSKAVFVVNGAEFRVASYKALPEEAPLWWVVTCNKAGP